jgi:hypothetical protein
MYGRTIDEVTGRGVQALVAWIHLDMHHVPAFELNITCFPSFAFFIAFEDKTTLLRPNEDQYLLTHKHLLSSTGLLRLAETE